MITNEDRIYIQPISKGTSLNPLLAPASKMSPSIPMVSEFINHSPSFEVLHSILQKMSKYLFMQNWHKEVYLFPTSHRSGSTKTYF